MSAVSNAGPIIHLSWIGRLDLLPTLFDRIVVPLAVRDEVLRGGPQVPGITAIHDAFTSDWLTVQPVSNLAAVATLRTELDRGESEAIVLMREIQADVLLLDERLARFHAVREGLPMTGTIGILRSARNRRIVPAVMPLLEELRRGGFRVSAELVERIRHEETALGQEE